jgi:peptide/nickel transport system permease protein
MQNMGDPLATMGGRKVTRTEDRLRLAATRPDKPIHIQYIYWLIGNDWTKTDQDGDGVAETPGKRKGVLRGDWGISLVIRQPVTGVIGGRLQNTLLLMLTAETVVVIAALLIGIYSALHQYTVTDNIITAATFSFTRCRFFLCPGDNVYLRGKF